MNLKLFKRYSIIVGIISANIFIDQFAKYIVRTNIRESELIPIMGKFLILTRIENSGAFLSLGDSLPPFIKTILLSVLPCLVILAGLSFIFIKTNLSGLLVTALCFILGGGIANLYDRIVLGSVTDFFHMDFVIFQTGIFNLADVSIMIGMATILFDSYLNTGRETIGPIT